MTRHRRQPATAAGRDEAARRQRALARRDLVAVHARRGDDRARHGQPARRRCSPQAPSRSWRRSSRTRRCWRAISSGPRACRSSSRTAGPRSRRCSWSSRPRWRSPAPTSACRRSVARRRIALHVAFAAYGFMGMLALGLSYIVVPMFALSAAPAERPAWASFALAVLALLLAGAAALGLAPDTAPHRRDRRGTCRGGRASAADDDRAQDRDAPPSRPLVHARPRSRGRRSWRASSSRWPSSTTLRSTASRRSSGSS